MFKVFNSEYEISADSYTETVGLELTESAGSSQSFFLLISIGKRYFCKPDNLSLCKCGHTEYLWTKSLMIYFL